MSSQPAITLRSTNRLAAHPGPKGGGDFQAGVLMSAVRALAGETCPAIEPIV